MLGEYLNFIVSRSGANLPRTPPRPLTPAAISQRRLASPDPCSQSAILTICACLLAQGCQSTPKETIHDKRSCWWRLQGRQRSDRVRVVLRRAAACSGAHALAGRARRCLRLRQRFFCLRASSGRELSSGSHFKGTSCRPRA